VPRRGDGLVLETHVAEARFRERLPEAPDGQVLIGVAAAAGEANRSTDHRTPADRTPALLGPSPQLLQDDRNQRLEAVRGAEDAGRDEQRTGQERFGGLDQAPVSAGLEVPVQRRVADPRDQPTAALAPLRIEVQDRTQRADQLGFGVRGADGQRAVGGPEVDSDGGFLHGLPLAISRTTNARHPAPNEWG
jgi:hypothetical protein